MSTDRNRILEKIAALRARTVENGCTEAEAMEAAQKIAELMEKYDLSMTDVELGAAECVMESDRTARNSPISYCGPAVGYFTDTRSWSFLRREPVFDDDLIHGRRQTGWREVEDVTFFGLPHDVEIAIYLFGICRGALDRETERFMPSIALYRRPVRDERLHAFQSGMVDRMAKRLRDMKDEIRRRSKMTSGRDLVVVKSAVVKREFEKLGFDVKTGKSRRRLHPESYEAGKRAGEHVRFDPGVRDGRGDVGRIGR